MNDELATGGYLVGWNEAKQFKPKDGELVLIHAFGWSDWYGETAIYRENTKLYQRGDFRGSIEADTVDYWMHIPAVPKNQIKTYIVGSDYSAEEKLFEERRKELERQKCGKTSEEIAAEVEERIRKMVRGYGA